MADAVRGLVVPQSLDAGKFTRNMCAMLGPISNSLHCARGQGWQASSPNNAKSACSL